MKIILKKTYGKGTIKFDNKADMTSYILDPYNREHEKLNDDFDEYCKFNKLSTNIKTWNIFEIVNYFFPDYERIKNEN